MSVVIKFGSNVLTTEKGRIRKAIFRDRLQEVSDLVSQGQRVILVSSGAISYGLNLLSFNKKPANTVDLQAISAVGQGSLYNSYAAFFQQRRQQTAQILLTYFDIASRSQYINARNTLARLLKWKIIPVINENDTTSADEIRFGDNDFLAAQVAVLMNSRMLILLTDCGGLYTRDPSRHRDARRIVEVSDWSAISDIEAGRAGSTIGSGGMKSKVEAAEMALAAGIEVVIANGTRKSAIPDIISGKRVGTRFRVPAEQKQISSLKLWVRYRPASGRVVVDEGAARALSRRGKSLLPAGIVAVEKSFAAGEAVEVIEARSRSLVGKGITNYSSKELKMIRGKQSREVARLMPHGDEEVIHRDWFVLMEG